MHLRLLILLAAAAVVLGSSELGGVPGFPRDLSTIVETPTSVKVMWAPPANNFGSPVDRFKLEMSLEKDGKEGKVLCDQDTQSFLVTGLTSGVTYYFRVRAHNAVGWSEPMSISETPSLSAAAPVVVPGAAPIVITPRAVALGVTPVSPTAVDVAWTPAAAAAGVAPNDKYALDMALDSGFTKGLLRLTESNVGAFRASGLLPKTTYFFRVTPHNPQGYGEAASTSITTAPAVVSCPMDCSGNGICAPTGICTCLSRFDGPACNEIKAAEEKVVAVSVAEHKVEENPAPPRDPAYCAVCHDSCSTACRAECPNTCSSVNSAPLALCEAKCANKCSGPCTHLCPEICPELQESPAAAGNHKTVLVTALGEQEKVTSNIKRGKRMLKLRSKVIKDNEEDWDLDRDFN